MNSVSQLFFEYFERILSIGDYAILLQSGFSHCRAILWNFLSATTAIIGFLIGSYTSNSEAARQWIFAATIGMFLYIALVDLVCIARKIHH